MKRKHLICKWQGILFALLWAVSLGTFAQTITVRGTVVDDTGLTVIGASVVVESNRTIGTITDIDGKYVLENVPSGGKLTFSYMGMQTQTVAVAGRTTIDVTMRSDDKVLDEVVVVGYGVQKKANLTGSVASLQAEALEARPVASVSAALAGTMPGVTTIQNSGAPGAQTGTITIRGKNSINAASPLVIVDGVPGSMNSIDPQDIESISVLKDAASSAIYGVQAANGVILITTKKGKAGQSVGKPYRPTQFPRSSRFCHVV